MLISTEARDITDFAVIEVPFFITNNYAELQILPAIGFSFTALPF